MRRSLVILLCGASVAAATNLPKIPELPASTWPKPAAAEPFARELLARPPADALARTLTTEPELVPPILRNLGTAIMSDDAPLRNELAAYMTQVVRAAARASGDVERLVTIVVLDPLRYGEDEAFRNRIDEFMPKMFAACSRRGWRFKFLINHVLLFELPVPSRRSDNGSVFPKRSLSTIGK